MFYCDRCLQHFPSEGKLENHKINCSEQNECEIQMPTTENNTLKFENFKNQMEVPFIIYADIETLLLEPTKNYCESKTTKAYQQHEAYSVGFYFHCS